MPRVRVVLSQIDFLVPAADIVGDTTRCTLMIDGQDHSREIDERTVPPDRRLTFSPTVEASVDVANKSSFVVRIQMILMHGLSQHRPLGWIERTVQWPYYEGEYRDANANWAVTWFIDREGEGLGEADPADRLAFARDSADGTLLNTVGAPPSPIRVEVHPVLPVPSAALPPRPAFVPGSGRARFWSQGVYDTDLPGDPRVVQNPPVVPIVTAAQRAFAGDATTIRVTFMRPRTLRTNDLVWSQQPLSGNGRVEFVGGERGLHVRLRGVTEGEVGLELRYRGAMAASYRLLVRPLKVIPCRAQICHAGTPATTPVAAASDILSHINIANRFLMQLGILLQMDRDTSVTDNAVATGVPGIFRVQVPAAEVTSAPLTTAVTPYLNFRPWVFNFAYIINDIRNNLGLTTDFAPPSAATVQDSGTPSSSFISPCGIPPDGAASPTSIRLYSPALQQRRTNLFAMYVTQNSPTAMDFGGTIAHEFGHAVGLRHRVDVGGLTSNDTQLHPPRENLMHGNSPTFEAQDFDLLQARGVLLSPLVAHY